MTCGKHGGTGDDQRAGRERSENRSPLKRCYRYAA
jgi:hypothetical protein